MYLLKNLVCVEQKQSLKSVELLSMATVDGYTFRPLITTVTRLFLAMVCARRSFRLLRIESIVIHRLVKYITSLVQPTALNYLL